MAVDAACQHVETPPSTFATALIHVIITHFNLEVLPIHEPDVL
jgi:hypothetical protein